MDNYKIVAFLDASGSKMQVLRRVLEPASGERILPAAMVRPPHGPVHWLLTKGAKGLVNGPGACRCAPLIQL